MLRSTPMRAPRPGRRWRAPIDQTRPWTIVGEEVAAAKAAPQRAAAVDVAAGDRLPDRAVVLVDRIDQRQKRRRARRDVVVRAFAVPPAVVAAAAVRRLVVDLFEARPGRRRRSSARRCRRARDRRSCSARGCAGRTPRSPAAPRPARRRRTGCRPEPDSRSACVVGDVDVDAQHLAEQLRRILRAMLRDRCPIRRRRARCRDSRPDRTRGARRCDSRTAAR